MGSSIAVREPNHLTTDQLSYIANTEFVPQGLRGNKPAILACVMTGRALGLDDMSSLRLIHVVNGRPTFSAELMVQIVRRHGHSISGSVKDGVATVIGKRADTGDEMTSEWTLAMAQRAGLANKQVWKAYPEAMLWARAVSQLCRMLFADCFAGGTYTPEEAPDAEFVELEGSAGEPQAEETTAMHEPTESTASSPADSPSAAQIKKLNVLVGTLREAGKITTLDVWGAAGRDPWLEGHGEDPHWSPLRDSLTKPEASALIEWLTSVEAGQPADPAPLTIEQLNGRIAEHGIESAVVSEIGRRLFPNATGARDLSDVDRGRVWAEVEKELTNV